jgi:hypothetical protein
MKYRYSTTVMLALLLLSNSSFAQANSLNTRTSTRCINMSSISNNITGKETNQEKIALAMPAHVNVTNKQEFPLVDKFLEEGKLAEGETALLEQLKSAPHDDQSRFGLGFLQVMQAIEGLGQDLYKYGLRDPSRGRFKGSRFHWPIPINARAETLTYTKAREMLERFRKNLSKAEETMSPISDPNVTLPLHCGMIHLDLVGNRASIKEGALWNLYAVLNNNLDIKPEQAESFYIKFDRGDVHWLRGYCHLLMAMCDSFLAYDWQETFNCSAHLFFQKVESPYKFLSKGKHGHRAIGPIDDIPEVLDLIAIIHTIRWNLSEPQRMESALHHYQEVIAQSKESWKWIMAETDDDHEWLPNPNQTGVMPQMRVSQEKVTSWLAMMDQFDKLLKGETLIPFWRGDEHRGINLRKVFLNPRPFDLVLWVQGSAAAPYLEEGKTVDKAVFGKLMNDFGHEFPFFALWFN